MNAVYRRLAAVALATAFLPAGHAAIFEDSDARRAILELRQRLDESNGQLRSQQADIRALNDQISQLRRSLLDLNAQLETMRGENAKLRGLDEQYARDLAELQRRVKDMQQGVDDRIRRIEPQKVSVDGREFLADPEEKRLYEEAMVVFRRGDFGPAAAALAAFRSRYPASGYNESALFWLGNAYYGKRDYKEAVTAFRTLVSSAPESTHAPEALLSIANCQIELKDTKAARRTLDELVKSYPKSEAAQAARERLASLK